MRGLVWIIMLAAIFGTFHAARASTDTANALLEVCETFEREAKVEGSNIDMPQDPAALAAAMECWGYISAVMDFINLRNDGRPILDICPPGDATVARYIQIFTNYARRYPDERDQNAALFAIRAIREAFPCQ